MISSDRICYLISLLGNNLFLVDRKFFQVIKFSCRANGRNRWQIGLKSLCPTRNDQCNAVRSTSCHVTKAIMSRVARYNSTYCITSTVNVNITYII